MLARMKSARANLDGAFHLIGLANLEPIVATGPILIEALECDDGFLRLSFGLLLARAHRPPSITPRAGTSSGTLQANATNAPKENKNAPTISRHTIVEMKLSQPSSASCGSRSQAKPYMSAAS